MDNRWSLRKQNAGASLIAVIIALVVVGIIGILITQLTITNIHMKEVESSSKKNFYKTEESVDEISVYLNGVASDCMQDAYIEVLQKYTDYSTSGTEMQNKFTEFYLNNLQAALMKPGADVENIPELGVPTGRKTTYRLDGIQGAISPGTVTEPSTATVCTTEAEAILYVDLENNTVRLKNIKVKDVTNDYETIITTDIVFETPKLNFKGKNKVTDYMKYALIADEQINVNADIDKVDGNVYAGPGGIVAGLGATGDGGKFIGNTIITRGDIASQGGTISVGKDDGTSTIWAENVCTTSRAGAGGGSILLQGNSYIADDLTLNARNSSITLKGSYYGYNFQEKYVTKTDTKDADFSSAMIINAKNSKLDITGLSHMLLAGRTYISSGNSGNDVLMGESLSVRANQMAYYVDESYLAFKADGSIDYLNIDWTAYASDTGMSDIINYLHPTKPVIEYSFIDTVSGIQTYYYLNFASEQHANNFYAAYVSRNKAKADEQAEEYLKRNGLVVDAATVLTLKGDILYRETDRGPLKEKAVTIAGPDWDVDGVYWDYAKTLAIKYKSLQMSLTETKAGITGDNVRFTKVEAGVEKIDKSVSPLFEVIVDAGKIDSEITGTRYFVDEADGTIVVFVDNDETGTTTFGVETGKKGVVVATGDVVVEGNFSGMIISGGTISFSAGASVTGDSVLVADLFQQDANLGASAQFIKYFKGYGTLAENVIGTVEVSDYLSFQNWQKN